MSLAPPLPPPAHPSALLKALEGKARKRFGQHFLASPSAIDRIVALSELGPGQSVLEVGPGLGVLTEAMLATGAHVTAVELDRDLAGALRERLRDAIECGALSLVQGDAAELDLAALLPQPGAKCTANLPYNVGTRVLVSLLESPRPWGRLVLMFQREVALRLLAPPGDRDRGSLSVFVQSRARVRLGFRLSPGCFFPPPKVESAVVVIDPLPEPDTGGVPPAHFDAVVRLAFSSPRKTLRRVLVDALGVEVGERALLEAGVDGAARPAVLSLPELQALARAVPAGAWR